MSSPKAGTHEWERLLASVREKDPEVTPGAMFGMPCAKVAGQPFMGSFDGRVVFKLTGPVRTQALGLPGSELFDPSGHRPMREWIVVRPEHQDHWADLAEAALSRARAAQ